MSQNTFLLYGANGYTGELIARFANQFQLQPVLAGRTKEKIAPLAAKLNLPFKAFDLNDTTTLHNVLKEFRCVVHAAGPFQFTARQMAEACLKTGTHYLDINGDIAIFEMLKQYDEAAKRAGIMILPGVGFDVVPTDCLAVFLKEKLPAAGSLKLAFASLGSGWSHGTATTMATKMGEGGAARKNGSIIRVPLGQKGMWVDFGVKKLFVISIPWGDISTAHFSTGIPDIETFTDMSPKVFRILKWQSLFNWMLRTGYARKIIQQKINNRPAGPDDEMRAKASSLVWGQVADKDGKTMTARLICPEAYTLTAISSLLIAQKVLLGNFKPGYQTPASCYGKDLVLEIPGVKRELIES